MLKAIQNLHALICVATESHIGRKTINRALHRRFARLVPGYHITHQRVLQHIPANALCDITSLINEDGAKHRLRGFSPRNRVANRTKKSIAHHHDRQYSLSYNNELYLCYKSFIL